MKYALVILLFFIGANHITVYALSSHFTAVSFNSSEEDWIEITTLPHNTEDLEIYDDSLITKINGNNLNSQIKIIFSKEIDDEQILQTASKTLIKITKQGLTATTEQLILKENDKIIDIVCWQNDKPSEKELEDITNLQKSNFWPQECIDSTEIKKDESIIKTPSGWQINKLTGDLSDKIEITEIFPNPKGTDIKKEWIELHNASEQNIDLTGWQIKINDQKEELDGIRISPNQWLAITLQNVQLPNEEYTEIQLLDFLDNQISSLSYQKPTEEKSISKVKIISSDSYKEDWINSEPTKNIPNLDYYLIEGTITAAPQIQKDFQFTIKTKQQITAKIIFDEDSLPLEYLTPLMPIGTHLKVLTLKWQNKLFLEDFQIINSPAPLSPENKSQIPLNIKRLALLISLASLIFLLWKRKTTEAPSHS